MTPDQKKFCCALLKMSYAEGFGLFPATTLAQVTGLDSSNLADENTRSGPLWNFHPAASGELAGLLTFSGHGQNQSVGVSIETKEMLESWAGYGGW